MGVPHTLNRRAEVIIPLRPTTPARGIRVLGFVPEVRRGGDRQLAADRLDPVHVAMGVHEPHHYFGRRSSSACAKYAEAFRRISLARFNS